MLSHEEREALFLDLESDRVERKRSPSDRRAIRQAICAFANDLPDHRKPGVIFVGVEDEGACAHLKITDQLLRDLAQMRDDGNILPFPNLTVAKHRIHQCEVATIEVAPADNPPVRYNGRVWIRVGPRRAQATPEEERRLTEKRRAGSLSFDQQSIAGATLDDLDLESFRILYLPNAVSPDVLVENNRSIEQQLRSLRLLTPDGRPTVAAVLLFAKDPPRYLPGAYIQFARFEGTEITDPIRHQAELTGALPTLLRRLDEVLEANISIATEVRTPTEERRPDYPLVALQQLARNLPMHRSYESTNAPTRIYWFSDRIEFDSPGGLYGRVSPENFGKGVTDYRNPLLAEGMKILGYVQRFGLGIPLTEEALRKNGNPKPEYRFEPTHLLTILRRS
ncbi:ATP-binding protein [Verrucomicrobium sp. 3C]|uniref:ATP-binding protein n=1 Tax=Verrucomicrobium sp. 3C TaxID=1134055 RepID=UPI00036FA082|nr:ATP-binding protein [Verrucomicrobium sp. 3C]